VHKAAPAAAASAALLVPIGNAVAAVRAATVAPKKKIVIVTKTITGPEETADRWGYVKVTIVVKKTTTTVGTRKTVKRRITSVTVPESPNHTDRSIYINQQALPLLVHETLQLQFDMSKFELVSGATNSSDAFANSLQGALLAAKKV
jgi:uncharacterized protein with FMN-binding domain